MAVVEKPISSKLKLTLNKTVDGEVKSTSKTFSNIKPSASAESLYVVGEEIGNLQTNPVTKLSRINEVELAESV